MYSKVSDTTSEIVSSVVSNIANAASTIGDNVEEFVSSMPGVGDTIHNISSGMERLMTFPPEESDIENPLESNETFTSPLLTPDDSIIQQGRMSDYLRKSDLVSLDSELLEQNLGVLEDHFSEPAMSELGTDPSMEDIESAILKTKDVIMNCEQSSQTRREYVQRLVQLRLMLERAKEEKEVESEGVQLRQGHQLTPVLSRLKSPAKQFCDRCSLVIWAVIHVSYKCSLCDYLCHGKCVKSRHQKCPSEKYYEATSFVFDICPEIGLDEQDFRCDQCRNLITGKSAWSEPRLCDYTGRFYCPVCHWNARMPIPARIVHNWDFEERIVSQPSKHFLSFVRKKPLIQLEQLNPSLSNYIPEIHLIKKLRRELIVMKEYLCSCRNAQESRVLNQLSPRSHFAANDLFFSLQDLIDLNSGVLMPFLRDVRKNFVVHIKESCETCKGKGFICELCDDSRVIFPFDEQVSVCPHCKAAFHDMCFSTTLDCPRCIRNCSRRLNKNETK